MILINIVYDIVRQTYDIVYDVDKTYDIVGFYPIVANLTYDIVYDIVRQRTMSYTIYVCYVGIIRYRTYVYIGIIRYRTSISSKTNDMPYDVACDIVTYDIDVYDVRYCLLVFPGAVGTGH